MAAYTAVVSLMNTIEQMMIHPRLSTSFHNDQINSLQKKAALLLDFIEGGYNNYGGVSEEAQDLETVIASAAHTAEDMIESHIVNQILPPSADNDRETTLSFSLYRHKKMAYEQKKLADEVKKMAIEGRNPQEEMMYVKMKKKNKKKKKKKKKRLIYSQYLRVIIRDMDVFIKKGNELKEKESLREEQPTQHSTPLMAEKGEETAMAMVGFDDELIQLLDKLTNQRPNLHIISIVGMGGMGKTTLAKNLYAHSLIINHFDIRSWATVSQQYNAKEILAQLLSNKAKSSDKNINELGEQLHKTLFGRRYLIILDDMWSVEAWDDVGRFFPDNGNGSRIILTTRLSGVAKDCGSSCFKKKLLDENGSWELFCRKAFQKEDCPTKLEEVGKEIVKLCKGLPLSIVVIGGRLLKSPKTVRYWKNVARDIESVQQESLDVLLSSYNHLPPHLKPCFLYIGVLKSMAFETFHISIIIQLWIAEGFLKPNGGRVLEEIAEGYLNDLIDRNLISVGRRSKNGKMKSCHIHDLLRDVCLKLAEQQGIFHATQGPILLGTERRLIYNNIPFSWRSETAKLPKLPLARSVMNNQFLRKEFDEHRFLRILHKCDFECIEESLGCVNLRYLKCAQPDYFIYWNRTNLKVWELPSSISLVWNLHALILPWTYCRIVAPIEIWKMRQLRHIECYQIYLPHPDGQDDLSILENFHMLKKAVNLRLCQDVCEIIPNIKKLDLEYDHKFQGYDDSLMECLCNLGRLHKLESLKLITDSSVEHELSKILTFPSSLKKLSLSGCHLHWDDLTMIGLLPLLEVLNLEFDSVSKGNQWSPVEGDFQSLKFLKIYSCYSLRCWNAESFHFPVLEKLVLICMELEEIPWGIGEIPTLQLIQLDCCSDSAIFSALNIKEDQIENDDLRIQIDV